MPNIPRIRPQRKRKALNAAAFSERYLAQADEAVERGNAALAAKLFAKSLYWRDRHQKLTRDAR